MFHIYDAKLTEQSGGSCGELSMGECAIYEQYQISTSVLLLPDLKSYIYLSLLIINMGLISVTGYKALLNVQCSNAYTK